MSRYRLDHAHFFLKILFLVASVFELYLCPFVFRKNCILLPRVFIERILMFECIFVKYYWIRHFFLVQQCIFLFFLWNLDHICSFCSSRAALWCVIFDLPLWFPVFDLTRFLRPVFCLAVDYSQVLQLGN